MKIEESAEMPELKKRFHLWCVKNETTMQLALEWAVMMLMAGQVAPPPKEDNK